MTNLVSDDKSSPKWQVPKNGENARGVVKNEGDQVAALFARTGGVYGDVY